MMDKFKAVDEMVETRTEFLNIRFQNFFLEARNSRMIFEKIDDKPDDEMKIYEKLSNVVKDKLSKI